jgi:hypothetical protein
MFSRNPFSIMQMLIRFIVLALLFAVALSACATASPQATQIFMPVSGAPSDLSEASEVLINFFNLLHAGEYEQAAALYGGPYKVLQGYNPDLNPEDHAALWQNGCEVNGLQCKQIKNILEETEISATEVHFVVEFQNDDGSLFILGPCCGATETEMPSVSQFEYTVLQNDAGNFVVIELPAYVP